MLLMQKWNATFGFRSIWVPPKMLAVPVQQRGVFLKRALRGRVPPYQVGQKALSPKIQM